MFYTPTMVLPVTLRYFLLTLEPSDGCESYRRYWYWARDANEARQLAIAEHGVFRVDELGRIEQVCFEHPDVASSPHAPPPPNPKEWLTVDETAQLLDTSRKTIAKMIQDGRLTEYRLDGKAGRPRIKRSELATAMLPRPSRKQAPAAIAAQIVTDILGDECEQ